MIRLCSFSTAMGVDDPVRNNICILIDILLYTIIYNRIVCIPNYLGTLLVPLAAAGENTSCSGQGTQSLDTPC